MEKEIRNLLSVLITGNRDEVRSAKKDIDKLWRKDSKLFKSAAPVALEYLQGFDLIKKAENQAAFASGLSLFFLVLRDEHFDTLANFSLKAIQHPNGSVREAIRNTADWLFVSLTARAQPFVYPKGKKLTGKQKTMQKEAEYQYIKLVKEIEVLIDRYDEGVEKVQYIDGMKPSVNKSLQLFWSRLTESRAYQRILEKIRPLPYEISRKRKDIENEISELLKVARSGFDLEDIKDIIYNESSHDDLTDIIAIFDTGQGGLEIENILETVNNAWNYFPHKILDGLSPAEKFMEYQRMQQKENLPN